MGTRFGEIIEELKGIGGSRFSHVTISGGNPLLHKGIGELIRLCHVEGWKVAVETQATFWQDWLLEVDDITLSPKPPSSGMVTDFVKLEIDTHGHKENLDAMVVQLNNGHDARFPLHAHVK